MSDELYRIQDLCLSNNTSTLFSHLNMHQYTGETLGIMGLHDSGKTLLSLILSGQISPDCGMFFFNEKPDTTNSLFSHTTLIQRHSSLISSLSVAENIFVIRKHRAKRTFIHPKLIMYETQKFLRENNLSISPTTLIKNLSAEERRLIEILKAYILGAKLIIFDALPFSFLHNKQFINLYNNLKEKNISFIFTACDINHLQIFADRILFLNDQRIVKWIYNEKRNSIDVSKLFRNDSVSTFSIPKTSSVSSTIALKIENLSGNSFRNINFEIKEGEIVAVFDLFRNTTSELIHFLKHPQEIPNGTITAFGNLIKTEMNSAFIFADFNLKDCIFETLSTSENLCIRSYPKLINSFGFFKKKQVNYISHTFYEEYSEENFRVKASCHTLSPKERMAIYLYPLSFNRKKIFFMIYPERYLDYNTFNIFKEALLRITKAGNSICIITCDFEKIHSLTQHHLILSADSFKTNGT